MYKEVSKIAILCYRSKEGQKCSFNCYLLTSLFYFRRKFKTSHSSRRDIRGTLRPHLDLHCSLFRPADRTPSFWSLQVHRMGGASETAEAWRTVELSEQDTFGSCGALSYVGILFHWSPWDVAND